MSKKLRAYQLKVHNILLNIKFFKVSFTSRNS